MLVGLIVGCEIGFWALLLAGLAARYLARRNRLSTALLAAIPLVDVVLLLASVADLRTGGAASPVHGIAAIYLGVTVVLGPAMVRRADEHFAHRFAGGPPPTRAPRTGRARARHERRQWLRHLAAWTLGALIGGVFLLLIGDLQAALPALQPLKVWTIVLAVDALITLSYQLAPPRREREPQRG
ncbi:hypothetical protein GCM10027174_12030 [Salinifilum aidingensis]